MFKIHPLIIFVAFLLLGFCVAFFLLRYFISLGNGWPKDVHSLQSGFLYIVVCHRLRHGRYYYLVTIQGEDAEPIYPIYVTSDEELPPQFQIQKGSREVQEW